MEYKKLGSSDLEVSALCLGTMTFGEQNTQQEAYDQLDMAIDYGVNFIDTAELYPVPPRASTQGLTESYVGSWLKHQQRDQLVIASKITGPSRGMSWIRDDTRINRQHLVAAIDGSLARLQTDYIDVYQIHWPDRYVPMFGCSSYERDLEREHEPIMAQLEALAALVKAGKVRYIGLSNETPWGVGAFQRCAKALNVPAIMTIQNAYHLMNRTFEAGLAEVCHHEKVGLLAYSPLAFGHLTGKYVVDVQAKGRATLFPSFAQRYQKVNVTEAVQAYMAIAQGAGLSLSQMALAFVRSRWFTNSVIMGATSLEQLQENLESDSIVLTEDVLQQLEQVHQRYPNPAP